LPIPAFGADNTNFAFVAYGRGISSRRIATAKGFNVAPNPQTMLSVTASDSEGKALLSAPIK
jgi:hypothetical protein